MARGIRTDKSIASITAHLSVAFLVLAAWGRRHAWLDRVRAWSPTRRTLAFVAAALAPLALLTLVHAVSPPYALSLGRESGAVEPVQVALYLFAAWLATVLASHVRDRGENHRPYHLVAAACLVAVLEELDYFGIVRALVGRIDGMHVGAIHDLVRLGRRVPPIAAGLVTALGFALVALGRAGYLSLRFVRAEAAHPASAPFWVAALALGVAQVIDFDGQLLPARAAWLPRLEEPLELLAVVHVNWWLVLRLGPPRPAAT
ncbi:MAG TPA: hypothetical protein VNN07_18560 [Candidatus Tectomicrobia bacterium]|nr:hypothetical protein [Candidatus Tectomicrobia bacterium]